MTSHVHWLTRFLVAAAILAFLPLAPANAGAADPFPRDPAEALQLYESQVEDWADGPVAWLLLEDEEDRWNELETLAEKREFIARFWDRRDPDLRDDRNEFRERFYARVADANRRYRGFPRGWKSDRGHIHLVLGQPDFVRPHFGGRAEAVVWTYYTVGPQADSIALDSSLGEISVAFARTGARSGYRIYGGFGGVGSLPRYVRDALRDTRQASVVNPDLDISGLLSTSEPS